MTICDKEIVIKKTMFLCLKIDDSNKLCIDTDLIKLIFKVYEKGKDYSCQNLDIDNNFFNIFFCPLLPYTSFQ